MCPRGFSASLFQCCQCTNLRLTVLPIFSLTTATYTPVAQCCISNLAMPSANLSAVATVLPAMSTAAALVTSFPSVRISRYSGRYNSHTTNAALCAAWLCAVALCFALLLCMPLWSSSLSHTARRFSSSASVWGCVPPWVWDLCVSPKSSECVHRDRAYQMLAEVMWLRLSALDISILEKTIRMEPSGLV